MDRGSKKVQHKRAYTSGTRWLFIQAHTSRNQISITYKYTIIGREPSRTLSNPVFPEVVHIVGVVDPIVVCSRHILGPISTGTPGPISKHHWIHCISRA